MIAPADVLVVGAIALATSGSIALAGALVLGRLRTRTTTTSLVAVVLVALLAVTAGAAATATFMFVSGHDLQVLVVVVLVTGMVGLTTALLLGRAVVAASAAVGLAAEALADAAYEPVARPLPAELARLDRQLARAGAELREARDRERATESGRRDLVAWVSHDLRTPLAGIRAMAEALTDSVVTDAETVERYHHQIKREADRLAALVEDLFELSRIHSGSLRLSLRDLTLAELIDDAVASAGPLAAASGVRLVSDAVDTSLLVHVSPKELARVLRNLLANAIRHTAAGDAVHVRAQHREGVAEVAVQDACGGIPEQDLPRLFDVAFRGAAARTPTADSGAGLGLAIARGLAEAQHGRLTIGNAAPGCRALLHLPLRPRPGREDRPQDPVEVSGGHTAGDVSTTYR